MGQGNIYFYNSYKKYTEQLKVENENKKHLSITISKNFAHELNYNGIRMKKMN